MIDVGVVARTQRSQLNVRLEPAILEGLRQVQVLDGVPISEQVRRALRNWLDERGISVKTKADRGRGVTRQRS